MSHNISTVNTQNDNINRKKTNNSFLTKIFGESKLQPEHALNIQHKM